MMKIKADVTIEASERDLGKLTDDIGSDVFGWLSHEIREQIRKSEAWRDLKRTIYNACLEKLREEVAKEFVDKIKGESNG
jgi:uncharacterized protein YaaW (UPF0174 family)